MKLEFDVKYGKNSIELPINIGDRVYSDKGNGLSDLKDATFTLINQISISKDIPTKIAWYKHALAGCDKKDGLYDKSNGQMAFKANTWTAYLHNWQDYKKPLWVNDGYYAMSDNDKIKYFTINVGDLLVFADIPENVPSSLQELNALRDKYKDFGGIITGVEVYINFHPNGKPWRTNHIEIIKG